jgi:hypothetical protein
MSKKETGGAAFPNCITDGFQYAEDCMTLRDYFAAKAMGGMLADVEVDAGWDIIAKCSYGCADAMIAERNKEGAA